MSESKGDKNTEKYDASKLWRITIFVFIALLIIVSIVAAVFYVGEAQLRQSRYNAELNNRHNEEIKGVVVSEGKNEYKNINIDSNDQIKNNSGIELSKDFELAMKIETAGSKNEKITVNGITALGGLDVDNGYAKFQDLNGKTHIISTENIDVTYGGVKLSDNVINMMENVSYDNGKVIFDNLRTSISYDNTSDSAVIKYTDNNGIEFGQTMLNNLTEKDGKIYSGNKLLSDEQQSLFSILDRTMDAKYPRTKDDSFFDTKTDVPQDDQKIDNKSQSSNTPSSDNSSAKTNLKSVSNEQVKS